ncbi:EZH inhibitory protein [Onychomys torridus]|uniref:EZH inhibitory protein n=1 Tax=Onychomys torridus TaxID=38674 RepID=UPI00167F3012|nr:EZH inhibitory protein [Onychomys torridus]XP_036030103.1 EZH inhibitory protein [Onychomys torridus]
MSSFGANCPTGKDPRVPENQRGNLQGGCEPDSPGTELGAVRPKTRSQGDVGPPSEGATRSGRNQRESSWAEQPSGDLATRCSGDIGGRVLRSHATASGHRSSASEVSPEVCPPPDSVVDSTTLGNLPDPMSTPATPRRGRSVSRSSRSQTATPRRGRSVSRPSRSQTQGNPSTSGTEFLKRALTSTSSSPPRRPVRMRASSPSPPGRLYPIYSQDNECSSSSSSDSSSDVSGPSSPYK